MNRLAFTIAAAIALAGSAAFAQPGSPVVAPGVIRYPVKQLDALVSEARQQINARPRE